jgi:hypothetical protein
VNRLLCGCLTALIVCQAMIIAITVVLPAPVATSFSASRDSSALASRLAEPWVFPPKPLPNFYRSKITRTQLAVFIIFFSLAKDYRID